MWLRSVVVICFAANLFVSAAADERIEKALSSSQGAIGNSVSGFVFRGSDGEPVALAQFRGKPLLVTLIYTGCADVCPTIIENLGPAIVAAEDTLGDASFNVITIGFDTRRDTPERMKAFAAAHDAGGPNWQFLSADAATIERFSAAVGFDYFKAVGGFDHPAQITVLDGGGTIFSQIYGSTFSIPTIVDPLRDIVLGRSRSAFSLQGLGDRVKLFCTVYDPATGRYSFDYSLLASIFIGAGCLILVLVFLIREARKAHRIDGA